MSLKIRYQRPATGSIRQLIMILVVMLIGVSSAWPQLLTIYEAEPPAGIDAFHAGNPVANRLVSLYCRPLFVFSYARDFGRDEYSAELAEPNIIATSDPQSFKVVIKKDARFHQFVTGEFSMRPSRDSSKVTARDVVTTYKNLIDPKSEFQSIWYSDLLRKVVRDMVVVSDDTVLVTLSSGRSQVELALTFPVVPAEAVPASPIRMAPKSNTPQFEYKEQPWGSGPFVFFKTTKRAGTVIWRLKRSDQADVTKVADISMRSMPRQLMEAVLQQPNDEQNVCIPEVPLGMRSIVHQNFKTQDLNYPIIEQILFNNENEFLRDQRVRAALSVYLDRETLVKQLTGEADIITGPIPFKYAQYCHDCDIPYYDYKVKTGDSLLRESGWTFDTFTQKWLKDGKPLKIEIIGYAGSDDSRVPEFITSVAGGWVQHGVTATHKTLTLDNYLRRLKKGNYVAAFHSVYYHLIPNLGRHFTGGGAENYSRFNDATTNDLWQSLYTASLGELENIWYDLHKRIGNQVPSAFLWTPHRYAVYSPWIRIDGNWYPDNFLGRVEKWTIAM